jgi:outer membrane protein assembly factor BamE
MIGFSFENLARSYGLIRITKLFSVMFIMVCLSSLTACHYLSFAQTKTQQGNLLQYEKLKKLKIGMHKTDAAIILGNSLITPTFQKNRWDYVFTFQRGEGPIMVKRTSLFFENDKLVKIIKIPNE